MKLSKLLDRLLIKRIVGNGDPEIEGIQVDSRKTRAGDLFICLKGFTVDGHSFAGDAVANGAVAVLTEKDIDLPSHVVKVVVPDTRRAMAILSDAFFGQPTKHLNVIGVTGTNGKTTTTFLIEKILNDAGKKTGLIGTILMRIGEYTEKTVNTTPEAIELQRLFRKMVDRGAEYAVLEVSSHGLEMGRVRGCDFKTAIFTNLSHDHLDYHKTMQEYRDAKALLFSQLGNSYGERPKFAILNADDKMSGFYAKKTSAQIITYGIRNKADIRARDIELKPSGTSFAIDTFKGNISLNLKLFGEFNVYNSLAAIAACLAEGVPLDQIKDSLEAFKGIRGRFEPVDAGQNFTIMIDYAHNPDGLRNVLKTARQLTKRNLYCIVGCAGERDPKKRPVMANVAAAYSDLAILTSVNTRSEDPEAILEDMRMGLVSNNVSLDRYVIIKDRKEAIHYAIKKARPGDFILITGMGHETELILKNNRTIPFDDKEVVLELLKTKLTGVC